MYTKSGVQYQEQWAWKHPGWSLKRPPELFNKLLIKYSKDPKRRFLNNPQWNFGAICREILDEIPGAIPQRITGEFILRIPGRTILGIPQGNVRGISQRNPDFWKNCR